MGYKLDKHQYYLDYWKSDEANEFLTTHIRFDLRNKNYSGVYVFSEVEIDMPTHKAIQKQIEELGG